MRIDPAKIRIALPAVQQVAANDCGVAALLSILAYYGVTEVERAKAQKKLGTNRSGTTAVSITKFARSCGLRATIKSAVSELCLERNIEQRRPMLCAIQAYGGGHWVAAVGIDRDYVYLRDSMIDGSYGYMPIADFIKRWWDTEQGTRVERLGVVIYKTSPPYLIKTVRVK